MKINQDQLRIIDLIKSTVDPRAAEWHTGGGCTAIHVPLGPNNTDDYWLITVDGCDIPSSVVDPVEVGLYSRDGDRFVCFGARTLFAGIELMTALASHQF